MKSVDPNVRQLRNEIGSQLRSFRLLARRSVSDVAAKAGMSQSKLSRIELGQLPQSEIDIRKLAEVLRIAQPVADRMIYESRKAMVRSVRIDPVLSTQRYTQDEAAELDNRVSLFKALGTQVIPGHLQTADYVSALYDAFQSGAWKTARGEGAGIENFLVTRIRRQAALLDRRKQFSFVIMESALVNRFTSKAVLAAQYDHLINMIETTHVEIGFVSAMVQIPVVITGEFYIFDDTTVHVETLSERLVLSDVDSLDAHLRVFEAMQSVSINGPDAIKFLETLKGRLLDESDIDSPTHI